MSIEIDPQVFRKLPKEAMQQLYERADGVMVASMALSEGIGAILLCALVLALSRAAHTMNVTLPQVVALIQDAYALSQECESAAVKGSN